MKLVGRLVFVAGVALAVALFAHEGFAAVAALLRVGGAGLILAALFHVVPMLLNARAWQLLCLPAGTPSSDFSFGSAAVATWLRESVNGLLPVARIGGEVVAYRMMVRDGVERIAAAASLMVDMVLSMISQSLFTLMGIAVLLAVGTSNRFAWQLGFGFVALCVLGGVLVALQRSRLLGMFGALSQRLLGSRWGQALGTSVRIEQAVHALYAQRRRIVASIAWQLGGWVMGAGEIWLALVFIGKAASFETALVIEVAVQTTSSIAFLVPGAYGIQEGAFLLIGSALGLDGPTALALAASRRIRDFVIFIPGVCAWSWSELRSRKTKPFDALDA